MRSLLHTAAARALVLALLLATAACGGGKGPGPAPVSAVSHMAVSEGEIDAVQALLMRGERKEAEKALKQLAKRDPMRASVRLLRDSIERDPKDLLGPTSYAYTSKLGDSFEAIAGRLLGNRLKAYQLARYNGFDDPSRLSPGAELRIPGTPLVVHEAPRTGKPTAMPARATPAAAPAAPTATRPAKPSANPVAAQRARAAGLAALNRGAIDQAVTLLRRAHALDPANPLAARDLKRAERISATVRNRK